MTEAQTNDAEARARARADARQNCERCKALAPQLCGEHIRLDARRRRGSSVVLRAGHEALAKLSHTRSTQAAPDTPGELRSKLQRLAIRIGTDTAQTLLSGIDGATARMQLD